MTAALRYEWTRMTTIRSTWWITGGTVLAGFIITLVGALIIRANAVTSSLEADLDEEMSRFFTVGVMTQFANVDPMFYLMAFVAAIFGVLSWGHEYRHGMIRATLTAVPQRWAVFVAKFAVVGLWVASLVVISCAISLAIGAMAMSNLGIDYDWPYILGAVFRFIVYSVMVSWLAMAVTVLVRHQTFALVMLYLWPLGVETLLKGLLGAMAGITMNPDIYDNARFLPFNAGARIVQDFGETGGDFGQQHASGLFDSPLSALGGFLVFGVVVFGLMAAAYAAFTKRDA